MGSKGLTQLPGYDLVGKPGDDFNPQYDPFDERWYYERDHPPYQDTGGEAQPGGSGQGDEATPEDDESEKGFVSPTPPAPARPPVAPTPVAAPAAPPAPAPRAPLLPAIGEVLVQAGRYVAPWLTFLMPRTIAREPPMDLLPRFNFTPYETPKLDDIDELLVTAAPPRQKPPRAPISDFGDAYRFWTRPLPEDPWRFRTVDLPAPSFFPDQVDDLDELELAPRRIGDMPNVRDRALPGLDNPGVGSPRSNPARPVPFRLPIGDPFLSDPFGAPTGFTSPLVFSDPFTDDFALPRRVPAPQPLPFNPTAPGFEPFDPTVDAAPRDRARPRDPIFSFTPNPFDPETEPQPKIPKDADSCNCTKVDEKPKKPKGKQPRSVCFKGTYTERRNGLTKNPKTWVNCDTGEPIE